MRYAGFTSKLLFDEMYDVVMDESGENVKYWCGQSAVKEKNYEGGN